MRLRHIEVFFAIWRMGSVTGAAKELAISQSSVSKTLKHAEESLGYNLFYRMRGRMVLSEEGEILLNDASRIFEGLEQVRERAAGLKHGLMRSLRVVCLPSLGQWVLPQALVDLHAEHPKLSLEVTTKHEGEMLKGLMAREYDVAFTFGPADEPPVLPGLTTVPVTTGQMVLIEHGLGGWAAPTTLDEIDYDKLIGLSGRHFLGNRLKAELARRDLPERPQIMVQTYSVARELIANGLGCCIVDEITAITRPINVRIRPLRPEIRFGIYLVHREGTVLTKLETALLEVVKQKAEQARRR